MPAPISHHYIESHKQIFTILPSHSLVSVYVYVCVVCVMWMHMCASVWAVPKETDRHTSMKSTKPPLIPPVIYGSQIHVRLRLNKRSFVTDSSLWSGWIGFAVLLPQQICPALLLPFLLLLPQGFLFTHMCFQRLMVLSFPLTPQLTHCRSKVKARRPSSVCSELVTLTNNHPPSTHTPSLTSTYTHTHRLSAGHLYSRPHWVIDSCGGIIKLQEEREESKLWGRTTASRRERVQHL